MSSETRQQALDRVAASRPADQRLMYRQLLDIFFQRALGPDDGKAITHEQKLLVAAALHEQRDRFLADAGFESVEAMEAAQ